MKRLDLSRTGAAASSSRTAGPRLGVWLLAILGLAACHPAPARTIVVDSGAGEVDPHVVVLPDVETRAEPARSAARAKTVAAPRPFVPKLAPQLADPYADEATDSAPNDAPLLVVVAPPAPAQSWPPPPASPRIAPELPEPLVPRAAPRRDAGRASTRVTTPVVIAASLGAGGLVVAAAASSLTPSDESTGFALGALGIGAVGLGTAGLLLLLGPDDAPPPRSPDPEIVRPRVTSASVGPGSVAVTGRF